MKISELNGKCIDKNIDIIYNHLRKFAFNVDKSQLQKSLAEMKKIKIDEQQRKGWFFKTLLFKLNRIVDWKLAEELEREFEKRY